MEEYGNSNSEHNGYGTKKTICVNRDNCSKFHFKLVDLYVHNNLRTCLVYLHEGKYLCNIYELFYHLIINYARSALYYMPNTM